MEELRALSRDFCISLSDHEVLIKAFSMTTIKLSQAIKKLLVFIELVSSIKQQIGSKEMGAFGFPVISRLVLNLHELDNLFALKTNEVS